MKFLLDQDVYEITNLFLKRLGHDVVKVSDIGLSTAQDEDLLSVAINLKRVFITRDRDFGALVFLHNIKTGVIYLRINPANIKACHTQLLNSLKSYEENALNQLFIVIESGRYRVRKLHNEKN